MKIEPSLLQLYLVTDRRWLQGRKLEDVVEEALKGGVTLVQYREKSGQPSESQKEEQASRLVTLCHRYHVPLLIDDDLDLCLKAGADGVHVGQDDMAVSQARKLLGPDRIIGATAHNIKEAVEAEKQGADYLGSGAAFGSDTKKDARPIDRAEYSQITSAVSIPVCAIGGITRENIGELRGAGLAGVAVISGILSENDIEAVSRELLLESRNL